MTANKSSCGVIIQGLFNLHPNTELRFNSEGLEIGVSLNITKEMVPFLSPNNVFKGNGMYIYKLRTQLKSIYINKQNVEAVANDLLQRCMLRTREAKIKVLQRESLIIQTKINNLPKI